MKRLAKPLIDFGSIYDACANEICDSAFAGKVTAARAAVLTEFAKYDSYAETHSLYSFTCGAHGEKHQMVLGGLTKSEFLKLYNDHLRNSTKPPRKYYDKLRAGAELGQCPLCGFGQVSTLDHFLPKSLYPAFSILPLNLVPACKDCNKEKVAAALTNLNQVLHPYFEDATVEADTWLFAEIVQTAPPTVRYYAQTPVPWGADLKQRVNNHFNEFRLAHRFAVEAANALPVLAYHLEGLPDLCSRTAHLLQAAHSEQRIRRNSWKAALYSALASSSWYVGGGFRGSA